MAVVLCVLLGSVAGARAQSASAMGSVNGVVTDPQGRPIPGVHMRLRNTDFALDRSVDTDAHGRFTASFLPAGPYTVQATAPGFELKKPVRLTIGAGSSTTIELHMGMKGNKQSVTVTGTGPTVEGNTVITSVNRQEPVAANQVAGLTVTYLPNRDRDFAQFTQLSAGTEPDPDSNGLVVAGQRADSLKAAVDGSDFVDVLHGGQRGEGDNSLFFPQVAVREFQLVRSGATAEVGGTNAGFVNVVTKSGANKIRGEASYIGRYPGLTSSDAFGHSLDNMQNEFGGSLGGPIKKDRDFFYFAAEQDFLRIPYWTEFGAAPPASLTAEQRQIVGHSSPTAVFGRTDFVVNKANTLNLQVNYNRLSAGNVNADNSTRTLSDIDNQLDLTGQSVWARAGLTSTLGATRVNRAAAEWATDHRSLDPNSVAPEMFIDGFGVLGGNTFSPERFTANKLQLSDDLSMLWRGATIGVGGSMVYAPARSMQEPYVNGRFDFSSLADYLAGDIRRYRQTFVTGDAAYDEATELAGLYVAIKVPVTGKLALSAGLRWEGQFNPSAPATIAGNEPIANDVNQWQPRLGLAWNPHASTVVRVSVGLYDAPTPADIFQHVFTDNGTNARVIDSYYDPLVLPLVSSLQPLSSIPAGLATQSGLVYGVAGGFRNPRSFQAAGSVEQQLNTKLTATLGYVHNSTWALERLVNTNLLPPAFDAAGTPVFPSSRPLGNLGELLTAESNGHSSYDGFTATMSANFGRRSQLTANYTLARSRDDGSHFDPFQPLEAIDPFQPRLEAAYSDFDIRHNFNVSAVINLPAGFKANPILIARSGAPYTPILGFDTQNDGIDLNDRAVIDGQMAARNSLRQPAFANLDMRFVKDITLRGEGHHLDLFMDIFNVTGAGNLNFGPLGASFFGPSGMPLPTAGLALYAPSTTRFGGPREVQFTARLVAF